MMASAIFLYFKQLLFAMFLFVLQASNKLALEDLHFYDHIMYLLQLLNKIGQTDTYIGEKVTFLI